MSRPLPLALTLALAASCTEVVSLTRAVDSAADADTDATSACAQPPQEHQLQAWSLRDATRCLPAGVGGRACRLVVTIPASETAATWCTAARGREPIADAPRACSVRATPSFAAGAAQAPGEHGFYLDALRCATLTDEPGGWRADLDARLECVSVTLSDEAARATPCAREPVGAACGVGAPPPCLFDDADAGCSPTPRTLLRSTAHECMSRICLASERAPTSLVGACSCRCALAANAAPTDGALCACPTGYACTLSLEHPSLSADVRGRYCAPAR